MVEDARQLVGRGGGRLGSSEASSHAAVVRPQSGFAAVQGLRGKMQCGGDPMLDLARLYREDFPPADSIVWTQAQPATEAPRAREGGEIRAQLGKQSVRRGGLEPRDRG